MQINATTTPEVPKPSTPGTIAIAAAEVSNDAKTSMFRENRADNGLMNIRDITDVAPRTPNNAPMIMGDTPIDSSTRGINATNIIRTASRVEYSYTCVLSTANL